MKNKAGKTSPDIEKKVETPANSPSTSKLMDSQKIIDIAGIFISIINHRDIKEAKEVLAQIRKEYSKEELKAATLYLNNEEKKIIYEWVMEADKKEEELPKKLYEYITNDEQLNEVIKIILDANPKAIAEGSAQSAIAIDLETTGLDPHQSRIRLVQIFLPDHPVFIVDCNTSSLKLLQPIFLHSAVKVFHNGKFDIKFLLKNGIEINEKIFDTMLAEQLLQAGQHPDAKLKDIALKYLDIELEKEQQTSDWTQPSLTKEQLTYAANDAHILISLQNKLQKAIINKRLTDIADIEFQAIIPIAKMELNGMLLDIGKWEEIKITTFAKKVELEKKLKQLLKLPQNSQQSLFTLETEEINLNSPDQVKKALNELGIMVEHTDFKSLTQKAGEHEAIALLLEYRKVQKLLTSFIESLTKHINPVTGRIHGNFWQLGTASGRFSMSDPNLQQIPRTQEIRSCFTAAYGHKLVIADYSQIELRIAAEIAKDATMIEAYKKGEDLHRLTASLILNKSLLDVTKEDRQIAKSANFGLLFGMSAGGFRIYARNNYGVNLTEKEASTFRNKFFKAYQGLAKWHQETARIFNRVESLGKAETRTKGDRLRILKENDLKLTNMLNTPVQGTGADILKLALVTLNQRITPEVKILAVVHDEIILEVPEEKATHWAKVLSEAMIFAGGYFLKNVPIEASATIGDNWADK